MMIRIYCWAFIVFLLQAGMVFGANSVSLKDGRAELAIELKGGKKFSIVVLASKPNFSIYGSQSLWGAEQGHPASAIVKLDIRIGKQKIYIPFSAYADLANPMNVSLDQSGNDVVLLVNGGDGADAYTAELVFQQGRYLKKRRVVNGSFPDKAWEETRYSFNM